MAQVYKRSGLGFVGPRPDGFAYRGYPTEAFWSNGRPAEVSAGTAVAQFIHSVLGLNARRPRLFRDPELRLMKTSAIKAYDSQSKLLSGELRYVWGVGLELYWPIDRHCLEDAQNPIKRST